MPRGFDIGRRSAGRAEALFLALAIFLLPQALHAQFSIARPNFGVPEFAQTGGTFRVEVKATAGLSTNQWAAVLVNDLRSWTGTVEQANYGAYVDNNSVSGYRLDVRVPSDISPEVFALVVSHTSGGAATNRNAVSILRCIETNFYILHYADPQAEAYEPDNMDTGRWGSHGSIRELYWHAPAVRLANPRFMFDTGDELDNNYGSIAHYEEYKDGMCGMGVAVVATRGNNDDKATADWRSQIGVETYSITMGSFYICQKDVRENNYYDWFTNDYASSFADTNIGFRLFGQHFNSNGDGKCPCFYSPSAGQYPGLMLVGHGHANVTVQSSPYYVIESQQACWKGAMGFFQFVKSGSSWSCTTLTNHPSATWFMMMNTGAAPNLTNAFSYANDGSATTNAASINNSLGFNFWDGRVRFLMRHANLGYKVSGGEKLAEYDYAGGTNTAVLVKVNIAPSATTVVSLSRVDTDDDGISDDWEMTNFGDLTTATATSDFDRDGLLDRQEYTAGTDPKSADSVLRITDLEGDVLTGGFALRWWSATDRLYSVCWASNLLQQFASVATNLPGSPPENVYTDALHNAEPASFYRITVRWPCLRAR